MKKEAVASGEKDMKEKRSAGVTAGCNVRVICSALDSAPCVVLATDNQRILFDAGEGAQRLCVEHKVRLSKTEYVCFTQISAHTVAGAPGLALTCADSGCQHLDLIGPPGLQSFWKSTSSFTFRKQCLIGVQEVNKVKSFDAGEVLIDVIPITNQIEEKESTSFSAGKSAVTHICYVCHTKPLPGRFDVQRARALGVPVGPMFAILKSGEDVTLSDGSVVHSSDVIGRSEPPRFVAIVCDISGSTAGSQNKLPDESADLLHRLTSDPYWKRFGPGGENYGQLDCVFHYSGADITNNLRYREWLSKFNHQSNLADNVPTKENKKAKKNKKEAVTSSIEKEVALRPIHVLLGRDNSSLQSSFLASTIFTRKLHTLFPNIFAPLSVLQRKEPVVSADEVLDVKSTLRIHDSTSDMSDIHEAYEDIDMDDDEILALGPPQLIRNPNTTLLDAMKRENEEYSEKIISETVADTKIIESSIAELYEEAGAPGMSYTLLPKSSRGFNIPLSDEDAFLTVQREVKTVWTDPPGTASDILKCLEEATQARKNIVALQGSSFLFPLTQEICSHTGGDIDVISDDTVTANQFLPKSPAEGNRKVLFSDNVNDSSNDVRQDCFLLSATEASISFLGTGCAIPSKYRNVSGILLQITASSGMLLDCGEGTWQQLVRMTREHPGMCLPTSTRTNPVISSTLACQWLAKTIKVVWISHPHADHHLGLMTFVAERRRHWLSGKSTANSTNCKGTTSQELFPDDFVPLLIIAPPTVLKFLDDFTLSDDLMKHSYVGVDNYAFEPDWAKASSSSNKKQTYGYAAGCSVNNTTNKCFDMIDNSLQRKSEEMLKSVDQQLLNDMGIQSLENVKVDHCFQSFGVRVQSSQGWSLVYSGDTRPCPQLVRLGQGATILIHEATFDDTKPEEAVKKRHSTISEAIQIAGDMNAHKLILTHFSQRYPSMPPLPLNYLDLRCGLLLAFDFMNVKLADLMWTHTMNPALLLAFPPEICDQDDEDIDNSSITDCAPHVNMTESISKKRTKPLHQESAPTMKKVKSSS